MTNETDAPPAFLVTLPANGWGDLDDHAKRHRAAIRDMFQRTAEGDPGAIMPLLAPNVRFIQAPGLPYAVDAHGVAEAMAGLGRMIAAWARLESRLIDVFASGDTVLALLQMDGVTSTGKTYSGPVTELFRFEGDQIVEWRPIYWDTVAVCAACEP